MCALCHLQFRFSIIRQRINIIIIIIARFCNSYTNVPLWQLLIWFIFKSARSPSRRGALGVGESRIRGFESTVRRFVRSGRVFNNDNNSRRISRWRQITFDRAAALLSRTYYSYPSHWWQYHAYARPSHDLADTRHRRHRLTFFEYIYTFF